MEWVAVIAVVVLLVVVLRAVVRYVVRQMQEAAQKYRDAVLRDEIESTRAWLERQRQQPHG